MYDIYVELEKVEVQMQTENQATAIVEQFNRELSGVQNYQDSRVTAEHAFVKRENGWKFASSKYINIDYDVEDIGFSTWSNDDEEIITQTKDSSPTQIMVKLSIGYAYQDKEAIEYVKSQRPLVVKTVKNYFLKKKKTEIENLKKVKLELVSELEDVLGNGYINKIDFKEFHMVAP